MHFQPKRLHVNLHVFRSQKGQRPRCSHLNGVSLKREGETSSEMSGKYSDKKFIFAHYGCCIPTEQYTWMLVVLFITTVLVLLFCMLVTATIRWMYKRRMRKRLHDLKRKFLDDNAKALEFETRLNQMAQKNKTVKNSDDESGPTRDENITVFVEPEEQKYSDKKTSSGVAAVPPVPTVYPTVIKPASYDPDTTPIAQSTLATKSNTVEPEDRWLYKTRPLKKQPGVFLAPPQPVQIVGVPIENNDDIPDGDEGSSDPAAAGKGLVPPSTTTEFTTTEVTTGTDGAGDTTNVEIPAGATGTAGASSGTTGSTDPSDKTIFSYLPAPTSSGSAGPAGGPGDEVKQNLQYGQNEIVTPPNPENARKEGAGGRDEWKYYYANGENKKKNKKQKAPSTTVTKTTSSSHRPSTRSWLFDSTGSDRFKAGHESSSRSSSILKTDSSQYRTASIEQFPHGAFTFQ